MIHPSRLLIRTVAPASEPVTLAEAKLFLRVDQSAEDALIGDLIVSARTHAEEFLRRSLITQTWKLAFDDYAPVETFLPRGPVSSVTSVVAVARDGSSQTISNTAYVLNAAKTAICFDAMVYAHRVEIAYVAGYGAVSDVPKAIKQGMFGHIAAMYDVRAPEGVSLPAQAMELYQSFRELAL